MVVVEYLAIFNKFTGTLSLVFSFIVEYKKNCRCNVMLNKILIYTQCVFVLAFTIEIKISVCFNNWPLHTLEGTHRPTLVSFHFQIECMGSLVLLLHCNPQPFHFSEPRPTEINLKIVDPVTLNLQHKERRVWSRGEGEGKEGEK